MRKDIEVNKFEKLVKEMYAGFPNWHFIGMVEKVVKTKKVRDILVKNHFFIKEQVKKEKKLQDQYMIGPAALPLVSAWNSEKLAKDIKILTIVLVIVGIVTISVTLIPYLAKSPAIIGLFRSLCVQP